MPLRKRGSLVCVLPKQLTNVGIRKTNKQLFLRESCTFFVFSLEIK